MRITHLIPIATLVALIACSADTGEITSPEDTGGTTPETVSAEVVIDLVEPDLTVFPEVTVLPEVMPEITPDFAAPGCEEGEGCFLDKCTENDQCLSGWCGQHMGEGVCTETCQEECPPGWSCKQVAGGTDVVYICASDYSNLCKPCVDTDDCQGSAGVDDVCVDYGDGMAFCGGVCGPETECPWGFSCKSALTVDGIETTQCVADAGECPCTAKSVALSLWTACQVDNEFGVCAGKRVCTDEGLTACDANEATQETCNGLDDDCDGDIDEPLEVDGDYINLCNDDNDCTADQCKGETGCEYVPLDGDECKDGDICTVADHCVQGVCIGDPVICEDENPCTDNICTDTGGCEYPANNEKCDDGNACTVGDECEQGQCVGAEMPCDCFSDEDCLELEDGDVCNGTLYCDLESIPHLCKVKADTLVSCPEPEGVDAVCLKSTCDPETGACSFVPDHAGYPCEEGDLCTIADSCVDGVCTPGVAVNCNDGNLCTNDNCEPDGGCVYEFNASQCDDGNVCTKADFCQDGVCQSGLVLVPCDDGNVCTDDSCDPEAGCLHVANQAPCDDGNQCTEGDLCMGGVCGFAALVQCGDENPCTDDSCDPAIGCSYALNIAECDDGDPCTKGDTCSLGACLAGIAVSCDDSNPCTDDSCQEGGGCVYTPNVLPCDDANPCTENSLCGDGACLPGDAVLCDDDNVCTTDYCDPGQGGCVFKMNNAPCNDGDLCTIQDHCELGECIGGGELTCDDGNDCTADSCAPGAGCVFTQTVFPCCAGGTEPCAGSCVDFTSDPDHCGDCNKPCNSGEVCKNGFCAPTCGPGQDLCGGVCTNINFDPSNCGECLKECPAADNAAGICVNKECSLVCEGTWDDCNLTLDDGCEVDLWTDKKHCGFCGELCPPIPNGNGGCAQGDCMISECIGTHDNCDDNIETGCETDLWTHPNHCGECGNVCGQGFVCKDGDCEEQVTSFQVHETKDITYKNIDYLLLKVSFASTTSQSENWCYEYRNLCQSYGYDPTGCGDSWPGSWYKECKTIYGSVTYDTSLSCNPSGPIAEAAKQNGYSDAIWQNSFGFHYCEPSACVKQFCNGDHCNNALTYIDPSKPHGYTLCIK